MTGIEPSPAACRTARARGVDAREGTLGDVTLESGAYDAAIFRHSLEHTDDVPRDLMAAPKRFDPAVSCWSPFRTSRAGSDAASVTAGITSTFPATAFISRRGVCAPRSSARGRRSSRCRPRRAR